MAKKSQKTIEQDIAERRAEIAKRMHVAKMGDGFHILEIPAADGSPFEAWPGPFKTKRAAELFLDELVDAYAKGNPNGVCCSGGIFVVFEQQARVLEFLEKRENTTDLRALARDLISFQPWQNGPYGPLGEMDSEIPF